MTPYVYKLLFRTAVHFGTDNGLLADCDYTVQADTLFSALLEEALLLEGPSALNNLVSAAKDGQLLLSNAFPTIEYNGDEFYYVPRPLLPETPHFTNSSARKAFKKKRWLRASDLMIWVNAVKNREDPTSLITTFDQNDFGRFDNRTAVSLQGEEPEPYQIATWRFNPYNDAALYVVVMTTEELHEILAALFASIGHSGIGGKRRSGLGRFDIDVIDLTEPYTDDLIALKQKLTTSDALLQMSLSAALPADHELVKALKDAHFEIERRGGFTDSLDYASTWLRRKDLFVLSAGSIFRQSFEGDVYDLSIGGKHPLYRYAKPLFLGVTPS